MKVRWNGGNGFKDLDLVLYGIMKPTDELNTGKIIEIPDAETELINRIKINGNYEVLPNKVSKPKKNSKKEKQEKKED